MAEISWIKLKTEMFSDDKIRLIESMPEADAILVIWIKLLIQAGKTNSNGFIYLDRNTPLTPEMLSTLFGRPLTVIKLALKSLSDFGMISIDERGVIIICNWTKHQNIEGMEKIKEQTRLRVQRFRENQKLLAEDVTLSNVTVTKQSKNRIDKSKNKDINKDNKKTEYYLGIFNMFLPPELQADWCRYLDYCYEREDIRLNRSTITAQAKFLREHIKDAKQIIDNSIQNNWKGLFEVKNGKGNSTAKKYEYQTGDGVEFKVIQ